MDKEVLKILTEINSLNTPELELLCEAISEEDVSSLAAQIANNEIEMTDDTLVKEDNSGDTVAHRLASEYAEDNKEIMNVLINKPDILALPQSQGFTVGHYLARYAGWRPQTKKLLKIATPNTGYSTHPGWTIAHDLAYYTDWNNADKDILEWTTDEGVSVKQVLQKKGKL